MTNDHSIFDTFTDADWDALYADYLEFYGPQEIPASHEWDPC